MVIRNAPPSAPAERNVVVTRRGRLSLEGIDNLQGWRAGAAPGTHSPFTQPERNIDSRGVTEMLCHINTDNETLGFLFTVLQLLMLMTNAT